MTGGAATSKSMLDVLKKLDAEFAGVAEAVENGEFALWVGSGISRNAPSLGGLIERAMEFLRQGAADPATAADFTPAFEEALRIAEAVAADVAPHRSTVFSAWPPALHEAIVHRLWDKYSELLDVRVAHKEDDYLLWDGVNIRDAFANPPPPAAEHLAIAILILEGVVQEIASANWDGFIEAAVERLGPGCAGNLQVVVDPDHLRDGAAKARLLKFHGCIVHATQDPGRYRQFLTGSATQINEWANNGLFTAMVGRVTAVATDKKAMMVGLSLQDVNLQQLFGAARKEHPWSWPPTPAAQGHVFCNAKDLGDKHVAMLKIVYGASYNPNMVAIKASALLQAWPEQVLPALALRVVTDKLGLLLTQRLASGASAGLADELTKALNRLRDAVAAQAKGDQTAFVNQAIATWSRLVSLYRDGQLAAHPERYEAINRSTVSHVANDPNAVAAGFGDLALALSLLEHGWGGGIWSLSPPAGAGVSDGALIAKGAYPGAQARAVFVVRSAQQALLLHKSGALNDNSVVIHGDEMWRMLNPGATGAGLSSPRGPRRPPGRSNRQQAVHVCLKPMVEAATDLDDLRRRFISEVTL